MIISFKYKVASFPITINDVYGVKEEKNQDKRIFGFPQQALDLEFDNRDGIYKIYYNTEIELSDKHRSTEIVNEVKRLYMRNKKIKKINDRKTNR